MYDVAIIGAGVIGGMIARKLAAYRLRLVLIEKGHDVATGATAANSAIVHAGFDAKEGMRRTPLWCIRTTTRRKSSANAFTTRASPTACSTANGLLFSAHSSDSPPNRHATSGIFCGIMSSVTISARASATAAPSE